MDVLALDIGGANLKLANGAGVALSRAFPLWQRPADLPKALEDLLAQAPACRQLAVTMTGELADCFATKVEGVQAILTAVEQCAAGIDVLVYLLDGRLVAPRTARADPLPAAASNWHALASFAARFVDGEVGLLLDVGSTTTDLIPLSRGGPRAIGHTDPERLVAGELVYTGVERSPLCAVVDHLTWRGEACAVAQELFATTLDAYLLLGLLTEDKADVRTADGRPRTVAAAHARLARSICADTTMFSLDDAHRAAGAICNAQTVQIARRTRYVLNKLPTAPTTIVLSGQGEFLARRVLEQLKLSAAVVSLNERLGPAVSGAACAHALAVLTRERSVA